MGFEMISCLKPAKPGALKVPEDGVAVSPRRMGRPVSRGGGTIDFIVLKIGAVLARGISMTQDQHRLRLLFGTGEDAGQVMVAVDNAEGAFLAKRDKRGSYAVTINAASAEGLFALRFPAFTRDKLAAHRPHGLPPHFIFEASAEMLLAEEG